MEKGIDASELTQVLEDKSRKNGEGRKSLPVKLHERGRVIEKTAESACCVNNDERLKTGAGSVGRRGIGQVCLTGGSYEGRGQCQKRWAPKLKRFMSDGKTLRQKKFQGRRESKTVKGRTPWLIEADFGVGLDETSPSCQGN